MLELDKYLRALSIAQHVLGERMLRVFAKVLILGCSLAAYADSLTVSGTITQSTSDGTGPAANNPSLNNIQDGDSFSVTLDFATISGPGLYAITSTSLQDLSNSASETAFVSGSIAVSDVSGMDQFSILACLSTGSGCVFGNQLDLNFLIPAAQLNAQNVGASGIPLLLPFDLLEDDGTTDIQGTINSYSYQGSGVVPEPSSITLIGAGLLGLLRIRMRP